MKITMLSLIAILSVSTASALASTGAEKFMEKLSETRELNLGSHECSFNMSLVGMPSDREGTEPHVITGEVRRNSEEGRLQVVRAGSNIDTLRISKNKIEIFEYVAFNHKGSITITVDSEGNPIKVASTRTFPKWGTHKINCEL